MGQQSKTVIFSVILSGHSPQAPIANGWGPHLKDFAVTIRWPSPKRLDSALFHLQPEHSSAAEALPTSEHKLIC
jgi:hypothetical protein